MTLTLELAPEVEAALEAAAKQKGRTREELVDEAVRLCYLPAASATQSRATLAAIQEGSRMESRAGNSPLKSLSLKARQARSARRVAQPTRPLSHTSLIVRFVGGEWPG